MAPVADNGLDQIDEQLKAIVQNLYNLIVQAVEHQGALTQDAMKREIQTLIQNLIALTSTAEHSPLSIPKDIITYVEGSRNPDVYTREFVELAQRENQRLKGTSEAFAHFRDILAREILSAIPELRDDVKKVVASTGGNVDG